MAYKLDLILVNSIVDKPYILLQQKSEQKRYKKISQNEPAMSNKLRKVEFGCCNKANFLAGALATTSTGRRWEIQAVNAQLASFNFFEKRMRTPWGRGFE